MRNNNVPDLGEKWHWTKLMINNVRGFLEIDNIRPHGWLHKTKG